MSKKTTTRSVLAQAAYEACRKMPRNEAASMVNMIFDELCAALARGENVKLSGFGTFEVRWKKERPGRNPKNGEPYPISARRNVRFRHSAHLVAGINTAKSRDLVEAE